MRWVSEGLGDYEVANLDGLERGTKIVLRLRKDCIKFSREQEVEKVIKKYSVFNKFPIQVNGHEISDMQAIWYRSPREVTEEEHDRFYARLVDSKVPYKFKLHYSTDVPLSIKALFYVPPAHQEKMEGMMEPFKLHLYSRKVLIKESCQELVPSYLRFIKGVVDCEDLPLNISRETYQDSNLVGKLKNVITRRILKMIEDESKRDVDAYTKWYKEFHMFLKEGVLSDPDNSE